MDSISISLSLIPISVYLLIIGLMNLSRHPFLVNGFRDTLAICVAVSGMIFVGPIAVFFPINAAVQFGSFIWVFLISLYVLIVALILLSQRPRLIVYNMNKQQFRIILANIVDKLDGQTRWAGDSLFMPNLNIGLHLESFDLLNNISLISNSNSPTSRDGWQKLERSLQQELSTQLVTRNPVAIWYIFISVVLLLTVLYSIIYYPFQLLNL